METDDNFYDIAFRIDKLVEKYSNSNLKEIESYFVHKGIKNYFFIEKLAPINNPSPWLKPLKEKGYFAPENNPKSQEDPDQAGYYRTPYWNVLGYLENVANKNSERPSGEITDLLLEIVNSIVNYQNGAGERIDNYITDWTIVKIISKLPIERITEEHIKFIGTSLKSKGDNTLIAAQLEKTVLPTLIDNGAKELVLKLVDVIFEYHKSDKTTDKYTPVMDEFWFNEALKKHKPAIAKLCGTEAAEIAIAKMHAIIIDGDSPFNYAWISTIEDHSQTSFPERYECQLVYFVRDMLEVSEPDEIREKINDFVKGEYPIFKRIALHLINRHYMDLNELFWNWEGNPIDEIQLEHELYKLLEDNCSSFSKKQRDNVLGWIKSQKGGISDEFNDNKKRVKEIEYQEKMWLSALLKTKNQDILASYKRNPAKLNHPGFSLWSYGGISGPISPMDKVELCNKSNEDITEYLRTYNEEQGWEKPSIRGLSRTFRDCVSENPEKFAEDMKPFLKVQPIYQHALIGGLSEVWRAKKDFTWDSILNFISRIIESDEFWNEQYIKENFNYRNWIISQIANLIEDGTKDDNHAFDAKLLPHAEKILLTLAEKTESGLSETNDIVTSVLNSPKGNIFSAMMNYSLRYARLFKKDQEERWVDSIKEDFDKRLNREVEPSPEFSVTLGKYLANLLYLDRKWVTDNINQIFPKEDNTHWKAAFTGYLFYSSTVYNDIYFRLRENGHYAKALQTGFSDSHITERLVQHICIGYIEEWEKLDDDKSLISQLLKNQNANQLSEIVRFFWMQREKLNDKIKVKIKPIWETLFNMLSENEEDEEYRGILAELSEWLSLIDEIDEETFEWLKLSAKYQTGRSLLSFIEYLLEHVKKTPAKVGKIYLEMLYAGIYPHHEEEDIQRIVELLYEKGEKEIADRICNLQGEEKPRLLRTIYKEHRNDDS